MIRSGRCYTPEELTIGGQNKNQGKSPISKGNVEEFRRKMQPKDYSIVKHGEDSSPDFCAGPADELSIA